MTMPPSKMSQAPSQATPTQVSPTPTPAQVIDRPITRSRAKKLQQEVHALLCEIRFNINKNYILPKCCTLIVLWYIEEEKDELDLKNGPVHVPAEVKNGPVEVKNGPVQRNLHKVLLTKAMIVHEHLLESLTSLLSNESSGDQFGYTYGLQTRISIDSSEGQQSVVTECWYNLPSKTVPIYNVSCWFAYIAGKPFESSFTPKKRFIIRTSQ